MMKGLELPLNMIVVIAIAVLVLTVVAIFFTSQTGSGVDRIAMQGARADLCQKLTAVEGCPGPTTSSGGGTRVALGVMQNLETKVGTSSTLKSLWDLCTSLGISSGNQDNEINNCLVSCGCPAIL